MVGCHDHLQAKLELCFVVTDSFAHSWPFSDFLSHFRSNSFPPQEHHTKQRRNWWVDLPSCFSMSSLTSISTSWTSIGSRYSRAHLLSAFVVRFQQTLAPDRNTRYFNSWCQPAPDLTVRVGFAQLPTVFPALRVIRFLIGYYIVVDPHTLWACESMVVKVFLNTWSVRFLETKFSVFCMNFPIKMLEV